MCKKTRDRKRTIKEVKREKMEAMNKKESCTGVVIQGVSKTLYREKG